MLHQVDTRVCDVSPNAASDVLEERPGLDLRRLRKRNDVTRDVHMDPSHGNPVALYPLVSDPRTTEPHCGPVDRGPSFTTPRTSTPDSDYTGSTSGKTGTSCNSSTSVVNTGCRSTHQLRVQVSSG